MIKNTMVKNVCIALILLLVPVLLDSTTPLNLGSSALAASKDDRCRVPPMKERTYKAISEAQVLIDPSAAPVEEGETPPDIPADPRKAVQQLTDLLGRRGLNSYEVAQIWNTLAFAHYTLEDLGQTKKAYEQVLKQDCISLALDLSSTRALFQLYYADENYKKSIEFIDKWEVLNGKPDTDVAFIKATAYYQMDEFQNSLEEALRVEQIAIQQEKRVKENWLYLQVVLYNELKDYDQVIGLLERLIVLYPKKQYWMHLAGMYGEKGWDDKALSAYYAAYVQGMFAKESELVMLAQRLLNAEVPFEAAKVLEQGVKAGVVQDTEKNQRLLATAYTMSRDYSKAIDAWKMATKHADSGEIFYRLAQALANEDRHKEAVKAYQDALEFESKGLKNPTDVQFWMGISLMQLQEWDSANTAFRAAAKDQDRRKSANQYIRYIESEQKRLAALAEMISAK